MFLCSLQINVKKCAIRGSVLQAMCGIPEKTKFHPAVSELIIDDVLLFTRPHAAAAK